MPLQTFQPQFYSYSTKYPESGQRIQLGNSYQFDAPPSAPDQRIFKLNLHGMAYFVRPDGTVDPTVNPGRNLAALEAFYNDHKRAREFTLHHPVYGEVVCKFDLPLDIPEPIVDGNGTFPSFEIQLIEIP